MMKHANCHNKYAKPILFIGLLLLVSGVYCYTRMQQNLFPEVMFPRIKLIAEAGQMPVDRMMITVTKPLESAVKKVQGVSLVKSSTSRGSCTVDVFFDWGTEIYSAKSQLESRVSEIKSFLPQGIVVSAEIMSQSLYPVYGYTLESDSHSRIEMRDVANLIVRPMFSQVRGINNVVVRGGKAKELVVIPDAAKMAQLGVRPADIKAALSRTNTIAGNGQVAGYSRLYLALTDTRLADAQALRNVVIVNNSHRTVRLKDFARIEVQEQQELLKINAAGRDAVLIDIVKQQGVSLATFTADLEAKVEEIRQALPTGYSLKTYYNQSAFVSDSIQSVLKTIYEGLILAMIVMVFYLRSWRSSLVVMLTIPVTIAFSMILMYAAGITINVMSLGAVAASVGLIIDDAIVIIEQIYREHEEHPERDTKTAVSAAISYLFPAMMASSLATIVIFLPFQLMSGMAGSFFRELSNTMLLTLIASFLVTWLLLPVLHLYIGYKRKQRSLDVNQAEMERQALGRVHMLTALYKRPLVTFVLLAVLAGVAFLSMRQMQTGFLPELDEGSIVLDYHTAPGTDIEETDRVCRQIERIITSHPEVNTYSRRTATGMAFGTKPSNYGDYLIDLKKSRTKTTPQVISELRRDISQHVPAVTVDFGQRISDLLGDIMSTSKPIEVKIFGDDFNTLQRIASQAAAVMQATKGITDVDDGMVPAGSSIVFEPDEELLSRFGISLTDFQEQLAAHTGGVPLCQQDNVIEPDPAQASMTGGLQIGSIQDGEQMRRILLRFTNFKDNLPERIMQQPVFLPDGSQRPVSFFCKTKVIEGEVERRREDLKACIVLTARLEGSDLGSAVASLQRSFSENVSLPQGYTISFGGAYQEQQQSFRELAVILCIAVMLLMCVLMFMFRQWKISVTIILLSLFGICGSLAALWLTGVPLNVSSYTGIIMIVGILTENAIFTVHQYNMNRRKGESVARSVDYAIALRIRPKLMTATGAILALLPLALGFGTGAQMQQPLAVAIIGGFVAGLPLLLVALPCMMRLIYHVEAD